MTAIIVSVLLLGFNALCVGGEFALVAARRTLIEPQAENSRRARWTLQAMDRLQLMTTGAQIGITFSTLGLGAVAEPAVAHRLEPLFELLGVPKALLHPLALTIALIIVGYLHTVVGEMVAKNLVLAMPERAALWLGPFMLAYCTGAKPLLTMLTTLTGWVLRPFGIDPNDTERTSVTAAEFAGLAAQSRTSGLLDSVSHARMTGALALSERTVSEVLLPWREVAKVPDSVSPAALELSANRRERSRFPVVSRAQGRVVGFVHIKDAAGITGARRREPIPADLIRPLPTTVPDRSLADLLVAMRRNTQHMVLVAEQGEPLGIVTLADVISAVAPEDAGR